MGSLATNLFVADGQNLGDSEHLVLIYWYFLFLFSKPYDSSLHYVLYKISCYSWHIGIFYLYFRTGTVEILAIDFPIIGDLCFTFYVTKQVILDQV